MLNKIKEVRTFEWSNIKNVKLDICKELFDGISEENIFLTSSGEASFNIVLSYLRRSGHLQDKNSEVWVSKCMDTQEYNIMQKQCFPSIIASESTKAVVIHHQFGYPQNMERIMEKARMNKWFVIENCAQAIMSYYNGKRVGLFGDAGIFSFSKFFPSLLGGAIVTKNNGLKFFIKNNLSMANDWGGIFTFLSKAFYEKSNYKRVRSFWGKWVEMSHNVSDLHIRLNPIVEKIIKKSLFEKSLTKRNENRDFFLSRLYRLNIFNKISELENVTPFVMPIIVDKTRLNNIFSQLQNIGVYTDLNHFDINRDMMDPNFKKCILLPLHEGVNHKYRGLIVDAVIRGFHRSPRD